jgi:hypothetical protein
MSILGLISDRFSSDLETRHTFKCKPNASHETVKQNNNQQTNAHICIVICSAFACSAVSFFYERRISMPHFVGRLFANCFNRCSRFNVLFQWFFHRVWQYSRQFFDKLTLNCVQGLQKTSTGTDRKHNHNFTRFWFVCSSIFGSRRSYRDASANLLFNVFCALNPSKDHDGSLTHP